MVASPWVEWLARLGFAAKGVVYAIVGVLAVQYAFGQGGKTSGTTGAFETIAGEPFGQILLAIIALGLVGYSIWQFARAGMDADDAGSDMKGIAKRIGYACNGILHMGLSFIAASMAIMGASSSGGGESSISDWTATVMSEPFGRWLVGIGGVIVIGVGLYRIYKGYSTKFTQSLDLSEMNSTERTWTVRFGRMGLAAQGIVFMMIGSFFVQAAMQFDPNEARGVGGALQTLAQQPYGPWLLALVALGLVAHGIYNFILARYRRIQAV
ncbi:MAG: DUF1206 domain-containing protein [Anaerolineae bacterium]|nr:DUF1206 domain-containing protein [Anaerolineae bacterium]